MVLSSLCFYEEEKAPTLLSDIACNSKSPIYEKKPQTCTSTLLLFHFIVGVGHEEVKYCKVLIWGWIWTSVGPSNESSGTEHTQCWVLSVKIWVVKLPPCLTVCKEVMPMALVESPPNSSSLDI